MSKRLRQYLHDHYASNGYTSFKELKKEIPIQVDDQDDSDSLSEFANIFVTVCKKNKCEVELTGAIPITQEIADFAEIYDGNVDIRQGKISMVLNPIQIEALIDLAMRLRRTAELGHTVNNPNWHKISARTISSLYRLVRLIKEYRRLANLTIE